MLELSLEISELSERVQYVIKDPRFIDYAPKLMTERPDIVLIL